MGLRSRKCLPTATGPGPSSAKLSGSKRQSTGPRPSYPKLTCMAHMAQAHHTDRLALFITDTADHVMLVKVYAKFCQYRYVALSSVPTQWIADHGRLDREHLRESDWRPRRGRVFQVLLHEWHTSSPHPYGLLRYGVFSYSLVTRQLFPRHL